MRRSSPAGPVSSMISSWSLSSMQRFFRSPHGCADILRIDAAAAAALPGVIGVLTPDDVAAMSKPIGNLVNRKLTCYPAAVGRTRYFGEPIAVVVAETRYIAEDALNSIEVEYAPRPAGVDPELAAGDGAPILHDLLGSNIAHERRFCYGDPEAAFARADRVISYKVSYPRVNSTPIETYGVIADYDVGNQRYTVWSNFQGPFALHPIMCDALRVRGDGLRLISAPSSGGSFGIKRVCPVYRPLRVGRAQMPPAGEMDRGPPRTPGRFVCIVRSRHESGRRLQR